MSIPQHYLAEQSMTVRPPFHALHVFCIVVREGGFRQAAQALHLTPSAVSRQVQALEGHLRQILFERTAGNAAALTAAGRQLHEQAAGKMAEIVGMLEPGGNPGNQASILVDTSVTLAMHWLIPQLTGFRQQYPHIRIDVRTADGDINPSAPVDVFLRRDGAELCGIPSQVFMREHCVLVSSPSFAAGLSSREPDNMYWLATAPRIGMRSRPDLWPLWSQAHGMDARTLAPAIEFDNTVLAIQAAVQRLGVLVVPEAFVAAMLENGTLQRLLPAAIESGTYSFAVGRQRASPRVDLFTQWLKERGNAA
ncbi:LysR family transcriptional regulator [Pseudoduganella sp. R-31]|uniref:LysR family transcriptional regulator n=1 Tax=Pseudoduganella sp. R-31 TaxID=3404060 RepID=UPI003CF02706